MMAPHVKREKRCLSIITSQELRRLPPDLIALNMTAAFFSTSRFKTNHSLPILPKESRLMHDYFAPDCDAESFEKTQDKLRNGAISFRHSSEVCEAMQQVARRRRAWYTVKNIAQ